jgi:HlyD family secretion protein
MRQPKPYKNKWVTMNRRRWVIVTVLMLVAILVTLVWLFREPPPPENTAVVRRGSLSATVDALGRVEPVRHIRLSTQVSGRVQAIHAQEGDVVAEDALLLQLDIPEHEQAVEQARRSIDIRQQQLERALAAPGAAEIRLASARLRRATVARARAQDEYDEIADEPDAESSDEALNLAVARLEYEIAEAEFDRLMQGTPDLEIARLRLELLQAEHNLRQAERRVEQGRIRAPFGGTVLRVTPRVGENVTGFGPLIELADLQNWRITAQIDELDIAAIAPGQEVEVRLDAFPGELLVGQVEKVLPGLVDTRGATLYEARVSLDAEHLPLRPGMGATLRIKIRTVEDALLVPRRAVQQVGRQQVVTVVEGRRQRRAVVTTGLADADEIEILHGLDEGQVVLLH